MLYRLAVGGFWLPLVMTATAGNLPGSLITDGMGRLGNEALHRRWLRFSPAELSRAETWFGRWGRPALVLAWLPVIGDPLCLVAGLLRVSPVLFVLLVGVGKLVRYAFLAWLVI